MARDVSELGADVFDDTVDPKKKKISSKKRNYIIGLSCLGVGLLSVAALYIVAANVWLADFENIEYLEFSYPIEGTLPEGQEYTATITNLKTDSKYPSNFRIPGTINGYRITSIAEGAFKGAERLKSVTMTDNIESIGAYAFAGCENLKDFKFSKNITSIGDDAFLNTAYFNTFESDAIETFGSILLYVGNDYFKPNTVLLESEEDYATLPEEFKSSTYNVAYFSDFADLEITYFKNALFKNNDKLAYIQIPSFLTKLPTEVFYGCTNLKAVDFSSTSFNEISDNSFKGCSSLTSVKVSEHIDTIGKSAFAGTAINTAVALDEVTSVGEYAYADCKNITSVTIPDGFTSLPNYMFSGCTNLSSFSFENDSIVSSIGAAVFQGTKLTSFRFPKLVSSVGDLLFANCKELERVEMWNNVNFTVAEGSDVPGEGETVEDLNSFVKNDGTIGYGDVLGMRRINNQSFSGCTKLKTLALYDDNGDLIAGQSATGEVNFPVTMTTSSSSTIDSSGKENFKGTAIQSVKLDANLKQVSESCFDGVTSLGSVTFERYTGTNADGYDSALSTIQRYAFRNTNITEANIPNSVNSIGVSSFYGCKSLTTVHLPENPAVESFTIANGLFNGCSALSSINIPNNVTRISTNAFRGCKSLCDITIPEGCVTLDSESFVELRDDGTQVTITLPFTEAEVKAGVRADGTTKLFIASDWCDSTVNVVYKAA